MADPILKKVSELPALTEPAYDDLIAVVDVSETMVDYKTKRARLDTLLNFPSPILHIDKTAQAIPAGFVDSYITFSNETSDPNDMFDLSNPSFVTCKVAGWYNFGLYLFHSNSTGLIKANIRRGGGQIVAGAVVEYQAASVQGMHMNVLGYAALNEQFRVLLATESTQNITAIFTMQFVRAG